MILTRLAVANLRNITFIEFQPHHEVNWITGLNGAGKTALLEGIVLLARGRSFRGRKYGPLLKKGHSFFEVHAEILPGMESGPGTHLKMVQAGQQTRYIENGRPLETLDQSQNRLQVRLLADNAQQLIEGHPQIRRLFLDWNLFHVEPGYARVLTDFRRVLNQRNAWLRSGARGSAVWDEPYSRLALLVTQARARLIEQLQSTLDLTTEDKKSGLPAFKLQFRPGWPQDRPLIQVLKEHRDADLARGYSFYGPSRADFVAYHQSLGAIPSRGQTKLLVFYLQLGAQQFSEIHKISPPVWLIDDLLAELDAHAITTVLEALNACGNQLFVTAIGDHSYDPRRFGQGAVFHIKHGHGV